MKIKINVYNYIFVTIFSLVVSYFTFFTVVNFISTFTNGLVSILAGIPLLLLDINIILVYVIYIKYLLNKENLPLFIYSLKKYLLSISILSSIGFVSSITCGLITFNSNFFVTFIYSAYPLVFTLLHLLILGISFTLFIFGSRFFEESANLLCLPKKTRGELIKSIFYNIVLGMYVFYALYRLGTITYSPIICDAKTFVYVIPILLAFIVPIGLFVSYQYYRYSIDVDAKFRIQIISTSIALCLELLFVIYYVIMALTFGGAFSKLSAEMFMLDRILGRPISLFLINVFNLVPIICSFTNMIKKKISNK